METKGYYHFYANGDDAKNFIICEEDFVFQFNLIAICAFVSGVTVLSFSIEDSHPHALLFGSLEECECFRKRYECSTVRHICNTRGNADNVVFHSQLDLITDESHLMNTGVYTIIQATKDGKAVLPYDYRWGTGSMYFRPEDHIPIWLIDRKHRRIIDPVRYADLNTYEKQAVSGRTKLPDDWLVAGGIILPENYVNVKQFERIYRTHNCFRTFAGAGNKLMQEVRNRMAESRGVMMEDMEARKHCGDLSKAMFGTREMRKLKIQDRLRLAVSMKQQFGLSFRQLATICRLPESEVKKYVG